MTSTKRTEQKQIKSTAASILSDGDTEVLYSYYTPVAAFVPGRGYLRTETYYSVTTSRHINQWVRGDATTVPPAELQALALSLSTSSTLRDS